MRRGRLFKREAQVLPAGGATLKSTCSVCANAIIGLAAAGAMVLTPTFSMAQQLPTGGTVAAGSATVSSPNSSTLNVNQSSNRAVINWTSFSLGQGTTVNFNQPGSSSATLNRVTGSTPSSIAGTINAPGTVLLVNPNGIAITKSGVVNVGSFAASTLDIKDSDFMSGKYNFFGNGASAGVTNAGRINVSDGGFVALLGGQVANDGVISARLGRVGLGSGELITLDLSGDGFLSVAVPTRSLGGIVGADGKPLVSNKGKIVADGGIVHLSAATAAGLLRDAVNVPGSIRANAVGTSNGKIIIGGGAGGKVSIAGKVRANGGKTAKGGAVSVSGAQVAVTGKIQANGTSGGTVKLTAGEKVDVSGTVSATGTFDTGGVVIVTADQVTLGDTAKLDASGATGGMLLIGGDYQGGVNTAKNFSIEVIKNALTTSVAAGATLTADGTAGEGGKIVVWSDDKTTFAGAISATGAGTGKGGFAEVSGHRLLDFTGTANLTGPGGFGTLLLDPRNVVISSAANSGGAIASGTYTPSADDSILNVTTLQNALASGNVIVTTGSDGAQAGDITVASPITWSANRLTLDAYHSININAALSATGTAALTLTTNDGGSGGSINYTGGKITFANTSQSLVINGNTYTLLGSISDVQAINAAPGGHYALANDIDASATATWNSGAGFIPLGTDGAGTVTNSGSGFSGTLDGLGHTISKLTINRSGANYVGLIGFSSFPSSVSNIGIIDSTVVGGTYVGMLVGMGNSAISNAYTTGSVQGSGSNVGGLVGNSLGAISNSHSEASVTGAGGVGGLVGRNVGPISNTYAIGRVTGSGARVGGLIGDSQSGAITNSWASGAVSGSGNVGGLIGYIATGSVANSYWDIDSTGQATSASPGGATTTTGGLTSAQAHTQSSYAGLDFTNTWYMVDGATRPFLRSEYSTTITNAHQLQLMGMNATTLATAYTLANDINLGSALSNASEMWDAGGWVPVGTFTGAFSGGNHTISGLTINRSGDVGLFSTVANTSGLTQLTNFTLSGGSVVGTGSAGAVAGQIAIGGNAVYVKNVNSSVDVQTTGTNAGGLFGSVSGTPTHYILNSSSSGDVSGPGRVGGLIGAVMNVILDNDHATGAVTSTGGFAGGLVGLLGVATNSSIWVSNSSATGEVTGSTAGGLAGKFNSNPTYGLIEKSYASGAVTGTSIAGGLVGTFGYNSSSTNTIKNTYATGSVTAPTAGGLVGDAGAWGAITTSYASGSVNGSTVGGGLVGQGAGSIANSYAIGAVSGAGTLGGLVGVNSGTVATSYTSGLVSGGATKGGLVGQNTGTVGSDAYWDTGTTTLSAGYGTNTGTFSATGLTTTQARTQSSYSGFDFTNTWYMVDGSTRPFLRSEYSTTITNAHQLQLINMSTTTLAAAYTLANDINLGPALANASDMWGSAGFVPIGTAGREFNGTFDGGYHFISGLTINRPTTDYVGLFGATWNATIARVGLTNVNIVGHNLVGALGGNISGSVSDSFATGSVSGGWQVGGLIGEADDFASTGAQNTRLYANVAVNASGGQGGGLIGQNNIPLSQAYATGRMSGVAGVGGLIGYNTGSVTSSYYDSQTSGSTSGAGTQQTTFQLQSALPSGFDTAYWGQIANKSYAYLKGFYAGTPQVISGTAYAGYFGTPAASEVTALVNGVNVGSILTGANGYYNLLLAPGTITANSQVAAYTTGVTGGLAYQQDVAAGSLAGLNIFGTYLSENSAATTLSAVSTGLATAIGSTGASTTFANRLIYSTGTSFLIDEAINLSGALRLNMTGDMTQVSGAAGAFNIGTLMIGRIGSGAPTVALTNTGNVFASLGTAQLGTGSLSLYDSANLSVSLTTADGGVLIQTAGNLTLGSTVSSSASGDAIVLVAGGNFINNVGSTVLSAPNGRWIVYAGTPTGSTFGNLNSNNAAIWNSTYANNAPSSIASGNRYVFALQPTLTFTSTNTSKYYGQTGDVSSSYTVSSNVSGVTNAFTVPSVSSLYTGTPTLSSAGTATTATVAGGPYTIDVAQGSVVSTGGFALSFVNSGLLTVNKSTLIIYAGSPGKTYGQTYSSTSDYSASGLYNGDTVTSVTLTSAGAAAAANVGNYALSGSNAQGSGLSNYNILYSDGTLRVGQAPLTITATNASKQYGAIFPSSGTSGFTTSGLVNGDSVASVTFSGSGLAGTASTGVYQLNVGGASGSGLSNYAINYNPGQLTVTPAPLTVTANNASKTYGTAYNLGSTAFTTTGTLYNGNTVTGVTLTSGAAAATAAAGFQTIYASNATGSGLSNYSITYVNGTLTVNPAPLTITANDRTKTYGTNLGLGTTGYTVTSGTLYNSDTLTGVTLSSAGTGTGASVAGGPYSITASAAQGSGLYNYAITYVNGALTVTPAPLTVTANNASKTYDGTAYSGGNGVSYSGFVNGETSSALGGTLSYGGTAQGAVNAGSYTLTASGLTSSNYAISYTAGALNVGKANLTVTANSQNKTYGTDITFTGTEFTKSGTLYGSDSIDSVTLSSAGAGATANAAGIPYSIVASNAQGTGVSNYAITYVNGNMMVFPKALTVTATNTSKQYGTTLSSSGTTGFTTSGLVNSDSVDAVNFSGSGLAGTASTGVYQLNVGGASGSGLSNYSINYNPGQLTVTPAPLTITPQDQTKTYGTAYNLGSTAFTTSGTLYNGDTVTGVTLTSGATSATAAAGWQTIYASNATGSGLSNYSITYGTSAKLTVDPAPLTITANDRTKTYGTNLGLGTTGYTVTSGTLYNSDTLTGVTLSSTGTGTGASVAGGPYSITASAAQGSGLYNYAITYVNGALTVTPAPLTVTANNASKTYDGTAYSGGNGVSYSGLVNGETSSVLGGTLSYGGTAQGAVNAGSYTLTASGQTSSNYNISYAAGALTVSKASLTVTANNAGKTYDGQAFSGGNGVSYSGFVNGETASALGGTLSYGGTAQGAVNAGSYTLTASGQTSGNYNINYVAGALTVAKANLTVTANNASKTYDGLAYSGGNGVTYSGLVNGETSSVLGGTLSYGGTAQGAVNAGSYTLTASGLTSGNYNISYVAGVLNVNTASLLVVTANDAIKTYGSTLTFNGTEFVAQGLQGSDTITSVTLASAGAAASANAGAYSITASNAQGSGLSNYNINYVAGTLTVAKANLTVTAKDASKTYDGLTYSGGNGVAYSGFVNGETSSALGGALSYGGTAQGAVNAGSYTLTASGLTSGNYNISYVGGALTVNKANLTVTANDASKTYNGLGYSGGNGVTYSGLVNGEASSVLGGTLTYGGTAQGAVNAGSYTLTASGLTSSNYTISYAAGALTVNKADLTVTANNASKTYDGLTYSGGNGVTYSGLVNGETASVLGGTLSYGGTAQGAVNAGSYTLTASGLTSGNYNISYAAGALSVDKASLTVTANNASKTYDGLTYSGGNGVSYSGLVNGETSSALGGALSYGGTAQGAVNAGSYTLTASGLTSSNYNINYAAGVLSVDKASLTVTANNASKTYDGTAYSGGNGVSYSGLVNGETSSVLGGTLTYGGMAQGAVNAGSYTLTASGLTSSNYNISYAAGALTVDKASLTVTANNASKTYDGLTYSGGNGVAYSGFVNGETSSALGGALSYGGTAQGAVNAGSYTLTASGLTSSNYNINYAAGVLSVDKASLTVTANNTSKTYDGLTYSGGNGVSYSGLVNGETSSALSGTLSYGGTAQGAMNAGGYTLTASGLTSSNYNISYVAGALTVNKASLTVTANDASKTYDGLTYSGGNGVAYSGFVNGETSSVLGGTLSYGGTAQGARNAGNYTLTASGLTASNYDISYAAGALTVNKATISAVASANGKVYDGTTAATGSFSSLTGVVAGDSVTVSGTATFTFTDKNVGAGKTVNVTGVSLSGADAGNYTLAPVASTTADITPATLIIALNGTVAATKVYDGTTAASVTGHGTLSGVIGSDVVNLTLGSTNYADANAGTNKTVTGTYSLSGSSAGNYVLASNTFSGQADITRATLTIASNGTVAATKVYDGTTASSVTGNGTLSGVIGSDVVNLTLGSTNYADANAGTNKTVTGTYSLGGSSAGNYQLASSAFSTTADITPATLIVASNGTVATTKVYDGTTAASVTGHGTLSGVIGSDVVNLTLGSTNYADANAGTNKTVTGTYSLSGSSSGNYVLASTAFTGTADITPATLIVASNGTVAATKVYDGTTVASVTGNGTLSGVIGADVVNLTLGSTNYVDANAGTNKTVTGTYSLSGSSAGNYVLASTSFTGTADITPATLIVASNGTVAATKVYDGTTAASVTGNGTLSGVIGADVVNLTLGSTNYADANAGTNKTVTGTYSLSGSSAGNYVLSSMSFTGTADITTRPITVTADPQSKVAGTADPLFTYQVTSGNLAGTDTLTGALTRVLGEGAGVYAILQGTLAASANYNVSYVGANLSIMPAPVAPANPTPKSTPDDYATSQYEGSSGGSTPPVTTISYQPGGSGGIPVISVRNTVAANTNTNTNISTTTTSTTIAAKTTQDVSQNIEPGGGPTSLFWPFSQFDSTQYSQDELPGYAPEASQAAVLAMIARAEANNRRTPKIDQLWRDNASGWGNLDTASANAVKFTDGNGTARPPAGDNGFVIENGTTDIAALLKRGPVMLGGSKAGDGASTPWLLALQVTADGKGILANDPITGQQVILAFDPATKTVGGVTGVVDPKTKQLVTIGDTVPDFGDAKVKIPPAAWSQLKTFQPASYFAVSM